jgi:hypothetical protein
MYIVLNWWSGLNVEKIIHKKFKVQFGYINEIFNITYQGQTKSYLIIIIFIIILKKEFFFIHMLKEQLLFRCHTP